MTTNRVHDVGGREVVRFLRRDRPWTGMPDVAPARQPLRWWQIAVLVVVAAMVGTPIALYLSECVSFWSGR